MLTRFFYFSNGPLGKLFGLLFFVLLGAFSSDQALSNRNLSQPKPTWAQLHFTDCHDGDTCRAKTSEGISLQLRFLGIDAPELGKPARKGKSQSGQIYGPEARDYLRSLVINKKLPVLIVGSDVYHRYLAVVFDENSKLNDLKRKITTASPFQNDLLRSSINYALVKKGFAYSYRGRSEDKEVKNQMALAEEEAAQKQRGFWALALRPEDPSKFRRTKKKH